MSRNQCLLRNGWALCELYSRCCMWLPCISTQFSGLHHTEACALSKILFSLKSPNRHSLLVAIGQSLQVSHQPKIQRIKARGSCRLVNWASASQLLFTKPGSGAVWQCGENEVVPHHTWTAYVVIDEEAHILRVLGNRSPENDSTLHLLACYVRKLVLRVDDVRFPPRHW
jgi:hypothetical protein